MKKYKIRLQDAFSFAIVEREAMLTEKQFNLVITAISNKTIVYSKLSSGIHWNFFPVTIDEI